MRPSEQKRLQDEFAARLARGQALLDQLENSALQTPPQTEDPPTGVVPPEGIPSDVWNSVGQVHAARGKYPGGRRRVVCPWMRPLARLMADGTTLQQAAHKLGLVFSKKDEQRIRGLREFETLARCYKRLYQTKIWGQPLETEAIEKLILQEEGRPHDRRRPRAARYVSHPRKPLTKPT